MVKNLSKKGGKKLKLKKKNNSINWAVVAPLIPALRRQRQVDLCEFEASLVYGASSRTGSVATEKPCLKKTN